MKTPGINVQRCFSEQVQVRPKEQFFSPNYGFFHSKALLLFQFETLQMYTDIL